MQHSEEWDKVHRRKRPLETGWKAGDQTALAAVGMCTDQRLVHVLPRLIATLHYSTSDCVGQQHELGMSERAE